MRPGITVALGKPVVALGQRYDALTLRRPNGRHLRAVQGAGSDLEVGYALMARLARVPVDVIRMLDTADQERITATAAALLPRGM